MLSVEDNRAMTSVRAEAPMGRLLRRYWYPIAGTVELEDEPTKEVRLLGEDLVLYKDRSGGYGLLGRACPHRRISLLYGIPEEHGLRCVYHGWLWDAEGRCLEQPAEPTGSTFHERVSNVAYPVEEAGGALFAYLGPKPVPLLPHWDWLVRDDLIKRISVHTLDCNWVQVMENSVDPMHTEYLHALQTVYHRERQGLEVERAPGGQAMLHHIKIGFDLYERGIIKRRILEGQTEEDDAWKVGHPVLFPNILKVANRGRGSYQFRVPMDDTHTLHFTYHTADPKPGEAVPERVEVSEGDVWDAETRRFRVATNRDLAQDVMAWVTQGPLMDRDQEHLGESDRGVILFRKLLNDQMKIVEDGGDPLNVFRDPEEAAYVDVPTEHDKYVATVAGGKRVDFGGGFGIFGAGTRTSYPPASR